MQTLKLIFSSLFKNEAALEGRKKSWTIAIILFLLSIVLAAIPLFTSSIKTNGSDFLKKSLYSFDNGLQRFSESLIENKNGNNETVNLVIKIVDEVPTLVNEGYSFNEAYPNKENVTDIHYFSYQDHQNKTLLKVYYQGNLSDEEAAQFISYRTKMDNSEDDVNLEIVSFLFLGHHEIVAYLYNPYDVSIGKAAGKDYKGVSSGDYYSFDVSYNLKNIALFDEFNNPIPTPSTPSEYETYQTKVFANWKLFFNKSYQTRKKTLVLTTTGMMMAINTIMALFMSLLVFLMTRGKHNPNRVLTFGESIKIGFWLLLSPAILSIAVGFLISSYASMAFVLLLGLRMMWLTSKSLRPPVTGEAPPRKDVDKKKITTKK